MRYAYLGAAPGRQPIPAGVPVRLEVLAEFAMPASASKLSRLAAESEPPPMPVRPDLDNLVKTVLDGLNGVAWVDDGQVTEIVARKVRTAGMPRLVVGIEEYGNGHS